ncbi:GTP pyrophosphokinase family protein [Rhodococcus rhodnii]|nr:GTP pyrophosphokinase family protein [Rhodococcus rhodnii]TXG92396.1 GTP pyrophosphokinase family protein [Rhodococcus rhodnii]
MMEYEFGARELLTKIEILQEEFTHLHRYSPIEHVEWRVKSPESLLRKIRRRGLPFTLDAVRAGINDVAGIRITCSFISDTYRLAEMITGQSDLRLIEVKDYIAAPKPNGYKSLHLIVEVPVYLTDRVQKVRVELQIRTIAMDFWASLEHKIYYKYDREIPSELLEELTEAAQAAGELDQKMERLHTEVSRLGAEVSPRSPASGAAPIPRELLELLASGRDDDPDMR